MVGVLGADGQAIDNVLRLVEVEYSQEQEAGHVTIHIVDTVAVIVLVHHHPPPLLLRHLPPTHH